MPKHQLADIQASLAARGLDDSWRLEAIVDSEVASVVGGSTLAPTTATKTPVLSAADEAATKRRTDMPTRGEDKQYPQNFNLAKMPPKRTGLPIVE